jgi:ABC-type Fe3+ transport system permease subunit
VTLVTVPLAFGFAYALSRSCIPAKGMFRTIALIPLLAPTLLSAISLIYWFGNQGIAKGSSPRSASRTSTARPASSSPSASPSSRTRS